MVKIHEQFRNKHNVPKLPVWAVEKYLNDSAFRNHYDYSFRLKLRALQIVSGEKIPRCKRCKCKELWALGINHINGGGTKERELNDTRGSKIYRKIVNKERATKDLEVMCHPCNIAEYMLTKYGLIFKVHFLGSLSEVIDERIRQEKEGQKYIV